MLRSGASKFAITTMLLWAAAAPVHAQQTSPNDSAATFNDIIVTAQRREERLQDVPLAVSAFTPDELTDRGVTRMEDLALVTPSFQTSRFVGRADAVSFGIRGQRLGDVRITNDPSVVTYIAEVPQIRPFGLGVLGFLDVRSVEVLRGPQGTLFGRNATGGAVLITPNLPTEAFEGHVRLTAGNYDRATGELVLSGGLAPTLSARAAVVVTSRDGWLENRGPFADLNSEDSTAARLTLLWEPSSAFSSVTYADYATFDGSGQSGSLVAVNPAGVINNYPLGTGGGAVAALAEQRASDFFSTRTSSATYSYSDVLGLSNTSTYQVNDSWLIKSILGYRQIEAGGLIDVDGTPYAVLQTEQASDTEQWSGELQIQYNGDRFSFIGGVFAFRETGEDGGIGTFFSGIAPPKNFAQSAENTSHSIFGEGTYNVTEAFSVTLGLRQTWDERQFTTRVRNGANCAVRTDAGVPYNPCSNTRSVEFDQLTWNLTGQYQFNPDHQIYGAIRRGYRTGGFNVGAETDSQMIPYAPETVDSYEVGYKGEFDWGDQALRFNIAAFVSDYQDVQKSVNRCITLPGATTCSLQTAIENAAAATIQGVELEATLIASDDLEMGLYYAYTDASYDEWNSVGAGGVPVDLRATRFGYLSEHKGGVWARYRLPLQVHGDIFVQGSAAFQSDAQLDDTSGPGVVQDGYTLYNARLEWRDIAPGVTFALWGNNLTNEEYMIGTNNVYASAGFVAAYLGEPRTYGVDLRFNF